MYNMTEQHMTDACPVHKEMQTKTNKWDYQTDFVRGYFFNRNNVSQIFSLEGANVICRVCLFI